MLLKKMFRDMMENKLAYFACILVISIGLMMYSGFSILMINLFDAKDSFYEEQRFANVFSEIVSFPESKVEDLNHIEGIRAVDGRLKQDVRVKFEDRDEDVYLRLISYDIEDEYVLNDVYLSEGYNLTEKDPSIWIGKKFLEANQLQIGDAIDLIINGVLTTFTISGAVESPEFVYAMKSPRDIYPSPESFEVAYIEKNQMSNLLNKRGLINDLAFELDEGYDFDDVKPTLENELKPYGIKKLVARKDQSSNFVVNEEMKGLAAGAQSMPVLFLSISSFILYIMIKRLIEKQRIQIGTLKAMGYSQKQIRNHYLSFALFIGLIGGILGGVLGTQLSGAFGAIYIQFFSFPNYHNVINYRYIFMGILLSLFFSFIAGWFGSKKALTLSPAEAMRPLAPKSVNASVIEKIKCLWHQLNMQGRMAVRNISRSKGRSAFTLIGVTFTFAMLVASWSFNDLVDTMLFDQFEYVQIYDMKISLNKLVNTKQAIGELESIDGVNLVEPTVELPITLKKEGKEKNTVLIGIEDDSQLYHVVDKKNQRVHLDEEGLYLSQNIATALNVKEGEVIRIESVYFQDEYVLMPIIKIIPQYLGSNGYANIEYINHKSGMKNIATAFLMSTDSNKHRTIKETLEESSYIGQIDAIDETEQKYRDLMRTYGSMIYSMAIMSMIIGFAIVYNSSIISFSEREREMASLKVLGMSNKEVLEIVSFEQWFLGFMGMIMGVPLGIAMMKGLGIAYQTDLFTMPTTISPTAFFLSILSTMAFIGLSQVNVMKRIKKMDIVEVLKSRE